MRDNWFDATVGQVAVMVKRGRAPVYVETGGALVLNQKCVRDGRVDIQAARRTDNKAGPVADWAWLQTGDTVVNSTGRGTLGRSGFVASLPERTTVDSHVTIVRPDHERIEGGYLALVLETHQGTLERFATGSTNQTELSAETIQALPIGFPKLHEQRRIVDLISTVDSAVDAVRAVTSSTAVLSEALESGALDVTKNGQFVELGQIAEVVGGITKDAKRQNDSTFVTVPYLRVANVQRGRLDLSEMSEIRVPPTKARELCLREGDVLLNEGGDRDKLGRGWVWEDQIVNCIHQNHVFRARIVDQRFDPYYVAIVANSRLGQRWFEENGSQTTNLASISMTTLRRFPVPELDALSQAALITVVLACREQVLAGERAGQALRSLREVLLAQLLSGDHEIPHTYDSLLTA